MGKGDVIPCKSSVLINSERSPRLAKVELVTAGFTGEFLEDMKIRTNQLDMYVSI